VNRKKHPNLHRVNWTRNWVFRRFSSEKGKEFVKSTGVLGIDANAALAYRKGVEMYDEWLGSHLPSGRTVLIRDIARALKASKKQRRLNTQRTFNNQIDKHILPHWGHLRPDQVTSLRWEKYDAEERERVYRRRFRRKIRGRVIERVLEYKRTRIGNTRRVLEEILNKALEEGLIKRVPTLKNFDPPPAPPRHIAAPTLRKIRRQLQGEIKFLTFLMTHQGPRPGEALRYRYDMIRPGQDGQEWISIPGEITKTGRSRDIPLNSRVARALRLKRARQAGDWVFPSPSRKDRPVESYNASWDRAMRSLGLDYTIYNVRDTFITNRLREGISSTFIGKYTDTSAAMIDRKYAVAEETIMRRVAG